ncbi:MAG: pteridine reductase [Methylococcales bacterium]|nr:pteridine reductase [Methylococcales bacterium]
MQKNVLITGAARRIGAGCARLLHSSGWRVILHYHSSVEQAIQLRDELNAIRKNSATAIKADLLNMAELTDLASLACQTWNGLDALVNNASQFQPGQLGRISETDWEQSINSNLKAPFFLSQLLAPALTARNGCIVNLVDIHAENGLAGYPVYSISKAGLTGMTRCLAKELAPAIRVNAVAPGAILWPETGMNEAQKAEILQKVALQRCGSVADIAKAVQFLICDADYITGQILTVDGGRHLRV